MRHFFVLPSFTKSLRKMKRSRQTTDRAVREVNGLLGAISSGDKNPLSNLKRTKYGETRIAKCIKYDLHDYCRLVTVNDGSGITLLFVGDHEDEEAWLDRNRGLIIGSSDKTRIGKTYKGNGISIPPNRGDKWTGKLIDRLNLEKQELIFDGLNFQAIRPIQSVEAGSNEETILASVAFVENIELKKTIQDTLILLNRGEVEEAERRIDLHFGEFIPLGELSPEEIIEVVESSEIKRIPVGSPEYMSWVESFINADQSFDWFLFMHPEQEKFVNEDYAGPVVLSGVSGSGKTAIAVSRAIRLAKKYSNEKILLITLNKALADLIAEILNYACTDDSVTARIDVKCYFELAIELIHRLEPENKKLYTTINSLDEHKDEVFREFYRCLLGNFDADCLLPTHFHLASQNIDAEKYISEEFDWIRSTTTEQARSEYLEIERKGRGFPLVKMHRQNVLNGLTAWEKKMAAVGVVDSLGVTKALGHHLKRIKFSYRSILIDEAQDFGTSELTILRLLVAANENDLFLCGDAAQQVQPKSQDFKEAGIRVTGRTFNLKRNYRNSKEILDLASRILIANLEDEHLEHSELEISDPELAIRSSAEPILLSCNSLEEEIAFAIALIKENATDFKNKNKGHTGCVAIAGFTQFEVEEFGELNHLPVLNGDKEYFGSEAFLSDLEQTKGFEFDTVIIVNCNEGVLPPVGIPKQEMYRFVSQFYVAMTRAKEQLVLSYSNEKSGWLANQDVKIAEAMWNEYISKDDIALIGTPGHLPDFPGEFERELGSLNGLEFVYTESARGLSVDQLEKIISYVHNPSKLRGKYQKTKAQAGGIEGLIDLLTSEDPNSVKQSFGETDGTKVVSAYLEALENKKNTMRRPYLISTNSVKVASPVPVKTSNKNGPAIKKTKLVTTKKNEIPNHLSTLKLAPVDYAKLHSLGLRTLQDVVSWDSRLLRDNFTKKKIGELKKQARQLIKSNAKKVKSNTHMQADVVEVISSIRISDAGFTKRTLSILQKHKVEDIKDIQKLEPAVLRKDPNVGNTQLLEIQRIAHQNGVKFKIN